MYDVQRYSFSLICNDDERLRFSRGPCTGSSSQESAVSGRPKPGLTRHVLAPPTLIFSAHYLDCNLDDN